MRDDDDDGDDNDDDDDDRLTLQSVFMSLTHAHYRQCAPTDAYRTIYMTRAVDEIDNKQYLMRHPTGH